MASTWGMTSASSMQVTSASTFESNQSTPTDGPFHISTDLILSSSESPPADRPIHISPNLYIIGGVVLVFIVVAIFAAIVLWKTGSTRRQYKRDVEACDKQGKDSVYCQDETAANSPTPRTARGQKRAKAGNASNSPAMEMLPIYPVFARDTESISQPLDSRQWARADADYVATMDAQSLDTQAHVSTNQRCAVTTASEHSVYDRLGRFSHVRSRTASAEGRTQSCADVRSRVDPLPWAQAASDADMLMIKSAEIDTDPNFRSGSGLEKCVSLNELCMLPVHQTMADIWYSSLTELAQLGSLRGKPMMCRVSPVAVMNQGKPVPLKHQACGSAYFVLKPPADDDTENGGVSRRQPVPGARFGIKNDTGEDASKSAGAGRSEYFILEPMDQQEEEVLHNQTSNKSHFPYHTSDEATEQGVNNASGGLDSAHDVSRTSCLRDVGNNSGDRRKSQSANSLLHASCPRENNTSPRLPHRRRQYRRSFSLPSYSQQAPNLSNEDYGKEKLDAETSKLVIERDKQALGFMDNTEKGRKRNGRTATTKSEFIPKRTGYVNVRYSVLNSSSNEYHLVEPDPAVSENLGSSTDTGRRADNLPASVSSVTGRQSPVAGSPRPKPRYQRQQTTTGLPPRLQRQAGWHTRSKSETHTFENKDRYVSPGGNDEGPVIVFLKKDKR